MGHGEEHGYIVCREIIFFLFVKKFFFLSFCYSLVSPGWLAISVHVAFDKKLTVNPLTLQTPTDEGATETVTGKPDVAIASAEKVNPPT
jgi:hypothetical protein